MGNDEIDICEYLKYTHYQLTAELINKLSDLAFSPVDEQLNILNRNIRQKIQS